MAGTYTHLRRRAINLPRSTWMIIIIVVGSTILVTVFVLTLWLCLRHRPKRNKVRPQYQYNKLQKRSRDLSPSSKQFSFSANTDMTVSQKNSTSSSRMSQYQTWDLKCRPDVEAQFTTPCQPQLESPQTPQRYPSQTSTNSWQPEHFTKGSFVQQKHEHHFVPPTASRPRRASISAGEVRRVPSARVPNYHTDFGYAMLIRQDINDLLDSAGARPAVPRKSSRRSRSVSQGGTRPDYEGLQVVEAGGQASSASFSVEKDNSK